MQDTQSTIKDYKDFGNLEEDRSIPESTHQPKLIKKITPPKKENSHKPNKAWYIKKLTDEDIKDSSHIWEFVISESMHLLKIPTPKCRILIDRDNDELYIISQKIGYDEATKGYLKTQTLSEFLRSGGDFAKIKNQFIKSCAVSVLFGDIDRNRNNFIVLTHEDGAHELYSIDFGFGGQNLAEKPTFEPEVLIHHLLNKNYLGLVSTEEMFSGLKSMIALFEHSKNKDVIYKKIYDSCASCLNAEDITRSKDAIVRIIESNIEFAKKQIKFFSNQKYIDIVRHCDGLAFAKSSFNKREDIINSINDKLEELRYYPKTDSNIINTLKFTVNKFQKIHNELNEVTTSIVRGTYTKPEAKQDILLSPEEHQVSLLEMFASTTPDVNKSPIIPQEHCKTPTSFYHFCHETYNGSHQEMLMSKRHKTEEKQTQHI